MNLVCAAVLVYNVSGLSWVKIDSDNLKVAKTRCAVHYPASPCTKKFIKVKERTYNVICGKNEPDV